MADSKHNLATEGFSGTIGNIVFRRRKADGLNFASRRPVRSQKEQTGAQLAHQARFQQAIIYGKLVNTDPVKKEAYKEKAGPGQTAFNMAVADLMGAPDIIDIDMSGYNGNIGSTIRITAKDDFKIATVHLSIENADGTLVEEGDAVLDSTGQHWVYTATQNNAALAGDRIIVTATDNPANTTVEERIM